MTSRGRSRGGAGPAARGGRAHPAPDRRAADLQEAGRHGTATAGDLERAAALLRGARTLVLTGAGISTESGIPDYRGPASQRRPRRPMRFQEFRAQERARRRYWARSLIGWPRVASARPNEGHRALVRLEQRGAVAAILTQNVDGLHQAAGSRAVLELHGNLATVRCLGCGRRSGRSDLQRALRAANPAFAEADAPLAPDGDVDLPDAALERFRVPSCAACRGILAPDVTFFGENVPRERVGRAWSLLERCDALLVAGSSLAVYSGYRFVRRATELGMPVAIVNDGATRGDGEATLRLSGRLGRLLPGLAELLR